ncbi:MAG: hypothetical protein R3335_14400 [Anaerolineales bacterium]|nr:hypothetical protein [Anaerolineales bacterium]
MQKEKYLTIQVNNGLSLGLGVIVLSYIAAVSVAPAVSDLTKFIGLVILGVVY